MTTMTNKTDTTGDVRLSGISKTYGSFTAVHPLDLTVPQGSFFALLGASGCGKTTTLRMIAGLEEPSSGTVFLGDQEVTHLPPYKRPVNTVFQSYALFPHLDIFENVAFGLRRRGIKSVKKQVGEMLDLVQLGEQARKKPHQLSGGQQQRVAVARALINHPKVLLLDEPLGALDLKLRRQMQLELKRIQTEVGITFVHVTHDQEEAMTMADTVAVMNAGRVEQLGSPTDLYENPNTTFVANFLGTSNLIEAEVDSKSGDEIVLRAGGGKLVLPETRCSAPTQTGGKVLVGVRPEKISLTHADDAGEIPVGRNRITGKIANSSFIGVSTQYVVDSPVCPEFEVYAQNIDRDARLVPRRRGRPALEPGPHLRPGRRPVPAGRDSGLRGHRRSGGRLMSTLTEAPPPLAPAAPAKKPPRRRGRLVPYWLLLPGVLWLLVFFALPMVYQASTSVQTGSLEEGYKVTWHFATYWDALSEYWPQFLRSIAYAAAATVLCLLLGYPLAYLIAFRAGRWRNLIMILVIAPFFTSFLIRTLAWKTILADGGPVVGALNTLHVLDVTSWLGWTSGDRVLATPLAVVCGLTYNFLPFMILPLYSSLERIDGRLHEAAGDLYAKPFTTFRRVTFPLSMPGVVSGTLLTFIPAAGDYVNADLLGSTDTRMVGNVIQSQFLRILDYPTAAALSFILMAGILAMVTVYIRKSGTEDLV
ncbi:spermidine/putrescine ABC transporter ATP-binding subunit [Streptomyces sp. V4I2]|nr:spermidine/putrescine ABC transporter ATP-binding subunit [Streptomyces sp. V4I2]